MSEIFGEHYIRDRERRILFLWYFLCHYFKTHDKTLTKYRNTFSKFTSFNIFQTMESNGASALFQRSENNRNLIYATSQNTHKPIQNPLPKTVVEITKPLFERLGSVQLLSSVASCRTQNVKESFHYLVWQFTPKDVFTSTIDTKCALYLAVTLFNDGYTESLCHKISVSLAGINFDLNMTNQGKNFDSLKLYHKNIQNTEKAKENCKKLKQKNIKTQEAFVRQEGTCYKSGAFHSLDQEKK